MLVSIRNCWFGVTVLQTAQRLYYQPAVSQQLKFEMELKREAGSYQRPRLTIHQRAEWHLQRIK